MSDQRPRFKNKFRHEPDLTSLNIIPQKQDDPEKSIFRAFDRKFEDLKRARMVQQALPSQNARKESAIEKPEEEDSSEEGSSGSEESETEKDPNEPQLYLDDKGIVRDAAGNRYLLMVVKPEDCGVVRHSGKNCGRSTFSRLQ